MERYFNFFSLKKRRLWAYVFQYIKMYEENVDQFLPSVSTGLGH